MAESLFARLEKLPSSSKKQKFAIKFTKSDKNPTRETVKIINKTTENFNRTDILKRIRRRVKLNKPEKIKDVIEVIPGTVEEVAPEEAV